MYDFTVYQRVYMCSTDPAMMPLLPHIQSGAHRPGFRVIQSLSSVFSPLVLLLRSEKTHIKKFAEIWSSCTNLFTISCTVSIVLTLCTHISFHSKDEFQIRKYHEKEQLLTNRMVPSEAQYTKTPLVIFTIKEHNHLQYISNGHFDYSNKFIHIS